MSERNHAAAQGDLNQTTLQVVQAESDLIKVQYFLLPDTNPGANANYVAIWQNYDKIPWNQTPEQTQPVDGSSQSGDVIFNVALAQNNYVLGYAVGPELAAPAQKYGNICSTAYIPRIGSTPALLAAGEAEGPVASEPFKYFSTNLTLGKPSGSSVTVHYEIPPGSLPKTNGAWIGIYRGPATYTEKPEKTYAIKSNDQSAWVGINGKFLAGKLYTIALFMSGYSDANPVQTRMAATIPFIAP
jgi:hypothetical protein